MTIDIDGAKYRFEQNHIEQSVWSIVRVRNASEEVGGKGCPAAAVAEAIGYIIVYVDDIAIA